jgi:hypothetical protein
MTTLGTGSLSTNSEVAVACFVVPSPTPIEAPIYGIEHPA